MGPLSPNLSIAQRIDDFHEQAKKNDGIKWTDYEKIQNIKRKDIPELKSYLDREINRIYAVQNNPDGSPRTLEQKDAEAVSWKRYLNSVNTLEASWKDDTLQVNNHHQETYVATTEKTRAKLKELFGEVEKPFNNQTTINNNVVLTGIPSPTIEVTPIPLQDIIVTGPAPAVLPTQDLHQSPQRIERRELSDMEILERNKKYITDNNINITTDATLQGYLDDPTRENIKMLQKLVKYPGIPDGIMGPITKKAIIDFLGRKESGNQIESPLSSSKIGFSHEGGKVILNARDKAGNIIQKLSYEDTLKLAREGNSKMNETQKGELNQLILLSTIGDIWVQAASKDMDTMLLGSFRSGGREEYKKQIRGINEYINNLQVKFQKGESIQSDIYNAYSKFNFANSSTGGFNPPIAINDLRNALDIVQSGGSLDARRASILETLSSKFDATTTGAVKSTAMIEVLKMDNFKDLRTKLADPKFMLEFTNGDSKKWLPILKESFGLSESDAYALARDLRDTRKGMESRIDEIRSALTEKGVPTDKIEEQIKGAKNMSLQMVMSKYVIDSKIDVLSGGYIDAYKQAKGDLTWNKAIDISVQMAISLVPMGAGILVGRGALAVGKMALATNIGGKVVPNMTKGAIGRFAGSSVIEGVGFYEGFNFTNNLLRNQDTDNKLGGAFEGWSDTKEIVKSVAMVGVIKSLGMIPGQRIETAILKDPTKMKTLAFEIGKIAGIAGAVTATSQGVEVLFGEGFNPTPEEYAQAVIMTALFRKFGGKNKKAESSNLPDGYELMPITSRKGIKVVRDAQKTDTSYKPEIVNSKGEVFLIESIKGSNGRETLSLVNKLNQAKSEITPKDLLDSKWALVKKPESISNEQNKGKKTDKSQEGKKGEQSNPKDIVKYFQENKNTINNQNGRSFMVNPDGSYFINNLKVLGSGKSESVLMKAGNSYYEMPMKDFAKWQSDMANSGNRTVPDKSFKVQATSAKDVGNQATEQEPTNRGKKVNKSKKLPEGNMSLKINKSPSEILENVSKNNLGKNEKAFVNEMKTAIKDIDTMNVKSLQAVQEKINDLGGESFLEGRIKENSPTVKVWESLLESIDIRIALKTPKQSFTDITSARKWIAEHSKTVTAGILLAIGGVTYKLIIDKQGTIEIQEAPEAGTGTINLPQDAATVGTITPATVGETYISTPTVSVSSITLPK